MSTSQVAYKRLDECYPPAFWGAVLDMDSVSLAFHTSLPILTLYAAGTTVTPLALPEEQPGKGANRTPMITPRVEFGVPESLIAPPAVSVGSNSSEQLRKMPEGSRPILRAKRAPSRPELSPAKMQRLSARPNSSSPPGAGFVGSPSETFCLQGVFRGQHGRHLEARVIAHSAEVQPLLDCRQIARGVQWEIVRGILSGHWTWEDVKAKIGQLEGSNVLIAPAVPNIIVGGPTRKTHSEELALWRELDREAKATVENKSRGLGLMGEFDGVPNYYGGNIQCAVRLLRREGNSIPDVQLEPLQLTGSHHLARELGSVSVIALRDNQNGALVGEAALHKFILCGRTYVALPPKSGKVYLIETNEDYDRAAQDWCGDQRRISYDEYIRRNNPMHLNAKQPFVKYLTRFNLYLSTSIPVLEFKEEHIFCMEDQCERLLSLSVSSLHPDPPPPPPPPSQKKKDADGRSKEECPPPEIVMTDGCGFLNRAAALKISTQLKHERPPVAYQGRINGSKGMWILHPSDESSEPRIWIRPSQKKIHLSHSLRAHRIFDLVAVSMPSTSTRLSAQSVQILAHNGVSTSVLRDLQQRGCRDLVEPLMDWKRPHATAHLWNAIDNVSNVTRNKLRRLAAGAGRALGFETRSYGHRDNEKDLDDLEGAARTGRNPYSSGKQRIWAFLELRPFTEPVILAEAAMDLLQAGFDPVESPYLSLKIGNLIKSTLDPIVTRYRIPLPTSFEAFIVPGRWLTHAAIVLKVIVLPDPSGQLKEGQVFYKSSQDVDGPLQEEVVIGRYPMREPSDMQKVRAVNIPDLAGYVDVLVIPVRGSRSLASLLAGGDTDGDVVIIIRDRTIVPLFRNQPAVAIPEGFQAENFNQQKQTVTDFGQELQKMTCGQAQRAFQAAVLTGLEDNKIGLYSWHHDAAVYETTLLLDASKTGLSVKREVAETDRRSFERLSRPKCFDAKKGHSRPRAPKLGQFVLDSLLAAGNAIKDLLLKEFETHVASHINAVDSDWSRDSDIEEPIRTMVGASVGDSALAADLKVLQGRIMLLRTRFQDSSAEFARKKGEPQLPHQRKKGSPKFADNYMLPIMHDFRQPLESLQRLQAIHIDDIKASYAFSLNAKFGFTMAFRDICEIKRRAEMKRGPLNRVAVIDQARAMSEPAQRFLSYVGN
ncbi:RNA dependent RNA polymerase-domain-containing protein [Mycena polygramma]|nr:RNA dependent RNA polymerase-domain-containing protein [Mycena polygramma]